MANMSRKATLEYVGIKRRTYKLAPRAKRRAILDEFCAVTGLKPAYARKLLNGNRKYRDHKGRASTYTDDTRKALIAVWNSIGCPCPEYLQVQIADYAQSYSEHVAYIKPESREQLLKMSASTMTRILKKLPRKKIGRTKGNKRSGRTAESLIKARTLCCSGERIMASKVKPGDVQIDTIALCGGSLVDNFFWILDGTDRKTQWLWLAPTWNRGKYETLKAFEHIWKKFPFPIWSIHSDGGPEILNYYFQDQVYSHSNPPLLSRSRPGRCNDNAHVEEKNGAVGRNLFGEMRFDCYELYSLIQELCDRYSLFVNFFVPSKMLISKEKRIDGKGFRCRYDKPKTPFERVLAEHILTPEQEARLWKLKAKFSPTELYHSCVKLHKKIVRIQKTYSAAKSRGEVSSFASRSASTLRVAPAGTAPLPREGAPTHQAATPLNP